MRKTALLIWAATLIGASGCTHMTPTQQGLVSGAAIAGAVGAAGVAATGGSWATGAAIGGLVGGAVGGYKGCRDERRCS